MRQATLEIPINAQAPEKILAVLHQIILTAFHA
jgi:hypothetical protein